MALKRDYNKKGAEKLKNFTSGVINGLRSDAQFVSLTTDIDDLETANTVLGRSILPKNESTKVTYDTMKLNKENVVKLLDAIRPKVETICNGDYALEQLSGFKPTKTTRSKRTSIDAGQIDSATPTGIAGQLKITLHAAIPGNTGFEVHYIMDGKDYIACVTKLKNRSLTMLATGLPSLKVVKVYLITLSTNGVRSTPSNSIDVAAS
jgi:hypothetical protein